MLPREDRDFFVHPVRSPISGSGRDERGLWKFLACSCSTDYEGFRQVPRSTWIVLPFPGVATPVGFRLPFGVPWCRSCSRDDAFVSSFFSWLSGWENKMSVWILILLPSGNYLCPSVLGFFDVCSLKQHMGMAVFVRRGMILRWLYPVFRFVGP